MKINITFNIGRDARIGFAFDSLSIGSFAEAKRKPASYEELKEFISGEIAVIMSDYGYLVQVAQEKEDEEKEAEELAKQESGEAPGSNIETNEWSFRDGIHKKGEVRRSGEN